jgi:Tfp pilus tip-associated adhesin PilY1
MKTLTAFRALAGLALAALSFNVLAEFDPVNDDTDIFLANPNITAQRPNVMIMIDNTANWNTPFDNEKSALVSVFNSLDESYNVGLMSFVEPDSGGSNRGGMVRYGIRQMTSTNRSALSAMVNGLDRIGDRGSFAAYALSMHEAYLYFGGKTAYAGGGQAKRDYAGSPYPAGNLPGNAFANSSTTTYTSPLTDQCQKSFIIIISNGPPDSGENNEAQGTITSVVGSTPPIIGLNPSGFQANWVDEYAKYMATADVHPSLGGTQTVITYVVEVDPTTTSTGLAHTALMKSTATNGKGKYFGVTSGGGGAAIVDALRAIFQEVQAVNSVFAATTLPVSVNVRGTNLNQVYIGVFRPDAYKAPRWLGNLKLYNLGLDTSTNSVFLADANGARADNPSTGFISGSALSFWTEPSTYWGFRTSEENGVGGSSDSPDGDLVEKGGVAQQIRIAHATSQTNRKLYTCTSGCTTGSPLSNFPFVTTNTDISAAALDLGTVLISTLTGLVSQTVTNLTDRLPASLNNLASPVSVSSLTNGAESIDVTNLTTAVPQAVTSIDARVAGTGTVDINEIRKVGGSFRVTTIIAHGFSSGTSVTISGNSVPDYNGTWTITVTSATTFTIPGSGNPGTGAGGTATGPALVNSTTATVTMPAAHGFTSGQTVTIAGADQAAFNGTFSITVTGSNTFTYILDSAQGLATGTITAAGNTNTARVTTATAHGLSAGSGFKMFGADPTDYNGTFTVASVIDTTRFTYTLTTTPNPNTASGVKVLKGGSTTAFASTSTLHGFTTGQTVQIAGASPTQWNGSYTITVLDGLTFTFTTSEVLPAASGTIQASAGTDALVTATASNHGFAVGQSVIVEGAAEPLHNDTFSVANVIDANTFQYCTSGIYSAGICVGGIGLPAPGGSPTVRPTTPKAWVTVPSHGYTSGQSVIISGASPSAYNGTFSVTVVNGDLFTYSPSTTPGGPNTSASVTSSVKTTTARAVAFNHGFSNGQTVEISGATPSDFNGSKTITVINTNTFTYTLSTPQGDAIGAMRAASSGSANAALRDALIEWVRGQDNLEDENADGSSTDIRASVSGDVLHSRPAVVNYNRRTGTDADTDVYVFYGSNDGVFRAVKGAFSSASGDPKAGSEIWGFIAPEFFPDLKRLRNNEPKISSFNKKPYFADGTIGVFTLDSNLDGKIDTTVDANDKAWLFMSMRRGGRFIYALDVSNPQDPKLLWKKSNADAGYSELGLTWSEPKVVRQINGHTGPVLVFGAGYDAAVEDLDPATITGSDATTVTTSSGTFTRSMGRGLYVVDAATGDILWAAGGRPKPADMAASTVYVQVSGMDCSISSDVAVIRNQGGPVVNRGYVGDSCANLWRLDFNDSDKANWRVTKLAAVANLSTASGRRKFLFAPDVVHADGFDAVLLGSGDREHPFDTTVINRMYMFKDYGRSTSPVTGNASTVPALSPAGTNPTLVEADLFDATTNCIQDESGCPAGVTSTQAETDLANADGWFITLSTGEKVVGSAVTLAGTTFFNTNQPSASAGGGACGSNLGIARQYQVSFEDATAVNDLAPGGGLTNADRSSIHAGGGYLPSPVPVVVQIGGQTVQAVISGVAVQQAPGATLQSRLRKFWYKEIE